MRLNAACPGLPAEESIPETFVASQTSCTAVRTAARSLSASAMVHGTPEHAATRASDPLRAPNIADIMVPSAPMTIASSKAGHRVGSKVARRTALIPTSPPLLAGTLQVTDTVLAELRNATANVTLTGRLTGDDVSVAPEQVYPVADESTEISTRTLLEEATHDTASASMPGGTQRLAHSVRVTGGSESERLSESTTPAPGKRRNASAMGAADGNAARKASDEGDGDSELVGNGAELRVKDCTITTGGMLGVSDREALEKEDGEIDAVARLDGDIKEERRGEVDGGTTAV